ncbi:MAG TPA: hypothetical protein VII16_04545 [Actinomycetes bacterium]|jgi:hypothetical protein
MTAESPGRLPAGNLDAAVADRAGLLVLRRTTPPQEQDATEHGSCDLPPHARSHPDPQTAYEEGSGRAVADGLEVG